MRKGKVSVILVVALMLVLALSGCSNKAEAAKEPEPEVVEEEVVEEAEVEEAVVSEAEEMEEIEESITEQVESNNDDISGLECSEEWARQKKGIYVKRDGKLYSVSNWVEGTNQSFGWKNYYSNETKLYESDYYNSIRIYGIMSYEEVPIVTVREGDILLGFGFKTIDLTSVGFYGYSIPIKEYKDIDGSYNIVDDYDGPASTTWRNFEQFTIEHNRDSAIIDDYRDLDYRDGYTVSWFQGTNYHKYIVAADSLFYRLEEERPEYTLDGQLSKESYAYFDFSNIPPGLYLIESSIACYGVIAVE